MKQIENKEQEIRNRKMTTNDAKQMTMKKIDQQNKLKYD